MQIKEIGNRMVTSSMVAKRNEARRNNASIGFGNATKVDISSIGYELDEKNKYPMGESELDSGVTIKKRSDGNYAVIFSDSSAVNRVIEKGYVMIKGKRITIDKKAKERLLAADKIANDSKEKVFLAQQMAREVERANRESDTVKKEMQKQRRVMTTAIRMMHGAKVSREDEKELSEVMPELYSVAKMAQAMAKAEYDKKEDEKEKKISKANAQEREQEGIKKDYSFSTIENIPHYETMMTVDIEG